MERPEIHRLDATSCEVLKADEGKKRRKFRMLANTGAVISRQYGDLVFDLSGIKIAGKLPMLLDHDSKQRAGFANANEITEEGLELTGILSSVTAAGKEVAELSDEGFPWQGSIGAKVTKWEELSDSEASAEVNGVTLKGPLSIARQSRLLETSFLMAGADSNTHAIALDRTTKEAHMTPEAFLEAHPDVVASWQETAVKAATDAVNVRLGAFMAQFAGREAWAIAQFLGGKTATEAKAALCDVLMAENAETVERLKISETLSAQVGVGFDGVARENPTPNPRAVFLAMSIEERAQKLWAEDAQIRDEFMTFSGFLRQCKDGEVQEVIA